MSIMNGKLTQTLKTQTMIWAHVGSARKSGAPSPSAAVSLGSGLSAVATSQFQDVEETTIGTTQGSRSSTLKNPRAGILVRSSSAKPSPTSQLPNTPTSVKTSVKPTAFQNAELVRTFS